jgi:membrane protein
VRHHDAVSRTDGSQRSAPGRLRAGIDRVWRRLLERAGRRTRRALIITRRAVVEFSADHCPQLAGAVAFHVLLSIFPLILVVVAAFGLFARAATVRSTVLGTVNTYIPITGAGQRALDELLAHLQQGEAALGLFGLIGVVISASGMMGALRRSLVLAWDVDRRRPFVRGKLLDLALVLAAGVLLGASFALTVAVRLARNASYAAAGGQGSVTALLGALRWLAGLLIPLALAFVVFAVLFWLVPPVRTRFVDIWHGALVAAILFQLIKEGFATYLTHFGHYNVVYGALGAVAAFIFFIYLSANALLFGAEIAAETPRVAGKIPERAHRRRTTA